MTIYGVAVVQQDITVGNGAQVKTYATGIRIDGTIDGICSNAYARIPASVITTNQRICSVYISFTGIKKNSNGMKIFRANLIFSDFAVIKIPPK